MKKAIDSILSMLMIVFAMIGLIIGSFILAGLIIIFSPLILLAFLINLITKKQNETIHRRTAGTAD